MPIEIEKFEALIRELMKVCDTPGISWGVMVRGEDIYRTGYGLSNLSAKYLANEETVYCVGSISKAFTAAGCGILVSWGLLSWDSLVSTYIPEFKPVNAPELNNVATLQDILSHQTGLSDATSLYIGLDGDLQCQTVSEVLNCVNNMTFELGSFRTTWSYNALVYSLAGLIIERASGISYSDFMLSNVFAPLGMTRTRVVPLRSINERQSSLNNFAIPYVISEDGACHQIAIKNYGYGPFASSAGCESTVTDILRFAKALMATKFTAAVNMELLSNEAASLPNEVGHILNVSCILPPSRFGTLSYCLGLFHMDGHHITEHLVDEILVSGTTQPHAQQNSSLMSKKVSAPPGPNRKIYFHSGYVPGFYSVLYMFPQTNSAVAVLENSSGGGDCAGRVGYLLSAVVSGDEPPRDLLGSAEAEREMDRCRWHTINQLLQNNLRCLQENDLGPRLAFENISGRYLNSTFGITIIICDYYDTDTQRTEPSGWELFFRSRDSQGLRLTPYHGTTWCFLPSKAAYYRRNMRHLSSWSQFLVHLHFDAGANEPRGLWWQYELTVDAIWFERAGDC